MSQDFGSKNFADNSNNSSGSGSKILFIVIIVVALVAIVGVVAFVWHPWDVPEQVSTPAVKPKTYSLPNEGTETVADTQIEENTSDAVQAWVDIKPDTDMVKFDSDAGYLPMNEKYESKSSGVDENGIPIGDEKGAITITYDDAGNVVSTEEGVHEGKNTVVKYLNPKHRWLEYSQFSIVATDTTNVNDKGIEIEFNGIAFNPTDATVSAEHLVPIYINDTPMRAYIADGSIKPGESGGFSYKFTTDTPEFDLTIYGFKSHVKIEDTTSEVGGDAGFVAFEYPLLNQEFADSVATRVHDTVMGNRSIEALAAARK